MWFFQCKLWLLLTALLVFGMAHAVEQPDPGEPVPEKEKVWKTGDLLDIGGKKYQLKFVSEDPTHIAAPEIAWIGTERTEQVSLWAKNKLYIVDPYSPKWQEPIACSWPVLAVSADRSRAVVRLPEKKFKDGHFGVVDLKKNNLLADFQVDNLNVGFSWATGPNWEVSPWIISADGRWVIPKNGMGGEFVFFDVKEKKIHRHNFFPKEKPGTQYWWGALLDGKEIVLFIRHGFGPHGRVHIPLTNPTALKFVEGGPHVYFILKQEGKKLFCHVDTTEDAWIDTTTMQVGPPVKDETQIQLIVGKSDPKGRWIYYPSMNIYDAKAGKLAAKGPGHDGSRANAFSLGVTFNTSGDVAAYATPYASRLTFIDTNTHKTLARASLDQPVSGAFLFDSANPDQPGTCLAVPVFLPYEK